MPRTAEIIPFHSATAHGGVLLQLKQIAAPSTHSYEMATYDVIVAIEALAARGELGPGELQWVTGKALDVMAFFRFDCATLAGENPWYRASVMHQIGCGMLQALRLLRPDLFGLTQLQEPAYELYRTRAPLEHAPMRPLHCRQW